MQVWFCMCAWFHGSPAHAGHLIACLVVAALSILVKTEVRAAPPDPERDELTFRIAKRGNPIMLPVEVGEGRYPFLFDTGFSVTSFDLALKPLLHGRVGTVQLHARNGERSIELFAAPPMSIGGRRVLDAVSKVACIDFETFRQGTGEVICGIIGMDVIKAMIVRIDFDQSELSVLPSVPEDVGDPIPLSYDELGIPSVRLEVGLPGKAGMPASALFGIDTGDFSSGTGELKLQLFESLLKTDALSIVDRGKYETVVGVSDERIARLSQLRLGPFRHSGLIMSDGLRNQLSLAYLSRYCVIFDFPHDRMYLSPGQSFSEPDFRDLSGMQLRHSGGDIVIDCLNKDGAADRAGLLVGDVILEIGGVPAASLSLLEVSRAFGRPSNRSITVHRPGLRLRMKIELDEDSEGETRAAGQSSAADKTVRPSELRGEEDEKQTFRIAKHGNPIVVPVQIGSERHRFLFDTGTLVTSFDKSLEPLLLGPAGSRRLRTQFSPDKQDKELFVAPLLYLGGRKLRGVCEVTRADQQPLREALGESFHGVLGMDALSELIVQIDFDQGALSILPAVPQDAGEPIKLALCLGQRAFEVGWLGDDPGYFLIDTGYISLGSGTLIPRRFQSLLDSGQATLIADGPAAMSARPTRSREVRIAGFSLDGESQHHELIFSEGLYNVLSLGYLSRYFVTIDFTRGRIYLKPSARFAAEDSRDLSGLELAETENKIVVRSVAAKSAGERAGLCAGDVIIDIDDMILSSLTLLDLRRLLRSPSTLSVKIRRGIATQHIELELLDNSVEDKQKPSE